MSEVYPNPESNAPNDSFNEVVAGFYEPITPQRFALETGVYGIADLPKDGPEARRLEQETADCLDFLRNLQAALYCYNLARLYHEPYGLCSSRVQSLVLRSIVDDIDKVIIDMEEVSPEILYTNYCEQKVDGVGVELRRTSEEWQRAAKSIPGSLVESILGGNKPNKEPRGLPAEDRKDEASQQRSREAEFVRYVASMNPEDRRALSGMLRAVADVRSNGKGWPVDDEGLVVWDVDVDLFMLGGRNVIDLKSEQLWQDLDNAETVAEAVNGIDLVTEIGKIEKSLFCVNKVIPGVLTNLADIMRSYAYKSGDNDALSAASEMTALGAELGALVKQGDIILGDGLVDAWLEQERGGLLGHADGISPLMLNSIFKRLAERRYQHVDGLLPPKLDAELKAMIAKLAILRKLTDMDQDALMDMHEEVKTLQEEYAWKKEWPDKDDQGKPVWKLPFDIPRL